MAPKTPLRYGAQQVARHMEVWSELPLRSIRWCTPAQAIQLYELALGASVGGSIVEVGSFQGASACWLGWAVQDRPGGGRVYCCDPWNGAGGQDSVGTVQEGTDQLAQFQRNVEQAGVADMITTIQEYSPAGAALYDGLPISMLYIDGLHTYDGVNADIAGWIPLCAPGAIVAFDDCSRQFKGVAAAVQEFRESGAWALDGHHRKSGFTWGHLL